VRGAPELVTACRSLVAGVHPSPMRGDLLTGGTGASSRKKVPRLSTRDRWKARGPAGGVNGGPVEAPCLQNEVSYAGGARKPANQFVFGGVR
jgi:hypothetical protein